MDYFLISKTKKMKMEIFYSSLFVIFAILAITLFIYYGDNAIFYVVAVIAIIIAFLNLRLIFYGKEETRKKTNKPAVRSMPKARKVNKITRRKKT